MAYVYILPPTIAVLRERLEKRGKDSREVIERRLAAAHEDLRHVVESDYVIINEDFSVAVADLQAVVRAVRLTSKRQLSQHAALFETEPGAKQ